MNYEIEAPVRIPKKVNVNHSYLFKCNLVLKAAEGCLGRLSCVAGPLDFCGHLPRKGSSSFIYPCLGHKRVCVCTYTSVHVCVVHLHVCIYIYMRVCMYAFMKL